MYLIIIVQFTCDAPIATYNTLTSQLQQQSWRAINIVRGGGGRYKKPTRPPTWFRSHFQQSPANEWKTRIDLDSQSWSWMSLVSQPHVSKVVVLFMTRWEIVPFCPKTLLKHLFGHQPIGANSIYVGSDQFTFTSGYLIHLKLKGWIRWIHIYAVGNRAPKMIVGNWEEGWHEHQRWEVESRTRRKIEDGWTQPSLTKCMTYFEHIPGKLFLNILIPQNDKKNGFIAFFRKVHFLLGKPLQSGQKWVFPVSGLLGGI